MKYVQNSSFCCFFVHYTTILPKKQAIHKYILYETNAQRHILEMSHLDEEMVYSDRRCTCYCFVFGIVIVKGRVRT